LRINKFQLLRMTGFRGRDAGETAGSRVDSHEIRGLCFLYDGWVAGRYLVESAAPRRPAMAEGGPMGNGVPFDATGLVPCAARVGEPAALQVHSYFAYGWLS